MSDVDQNVDKQDNTESQKSFPKEGESEKKVANSSVSDAASDRDSAAADGASSGNAKSTPSPFNCISGSAIAGSMAVGLYFLTTSIAGNFAAKPLASTNPLAQNISALVRTTVVGVSALGTGIFGIVALGLLALGIQTLVRGDRQSTT
ncbi:MAG: DUF3082 domain-containing protein [Cyanobacteria bacterium P01_C01_bin.89]